MQAYSSPPPWGSIFSSPFYVGKWLSPHRDPIDVCRMVSTDSVFSPVLG